MHTLLSISRLLCCALVLALPLHARAQEAVEHTAAQPALPSTEVTITTAEGKPLPFRLEIADDKYEQEVGLMFRTSLPEDGGMLFIFADGKPHYMWMKNTLIPLDMLFLNAEGKVLYVKHNAQPGALEPVGIPVPVHAIAELAGGVAEKQNITAGAYLKITGMDGE